MSEARTETSTMAYRRVGTAGLVVSEIGLGSWLTYGAAACSVMGRSSTAKAEPIYVDIPDTTIGLPDVTSTIRESTSNPAWALYAQRVPG